MDLKRKSEIFDEINIKWMTYLFCWEKIVKFVRETKKHAVYLDFALPILYVHR